MNGIESESEQDLELKLRFMRWLWNAGYLPRKNLNLTNLDLSRKGASYTDVDVFGIRFDNSFSPSIIVADCKTGRSTGKYERFFWLNGVMEYFGSTEGYFVRDNIDDRHVGEISKRLNIIPLSLNRLKEIEKIYNIDESMFFGSFSRDQKKIEDAYKTIRDKNGQIEDYIRYRVWGDPTNQQILTLILCCKEIDSFSSVENRVKTFAVGYTLTMLSVALLGFARRILFVDETKREEYMKHALLGGKIEAKDKKKLLYSFYDFMTSEITERYKQKYPISRSAFVDGIVPPYAKYFYDIVIRVLNNPKNSIYMPRILDYISHKILFDEHNYRIAEIVPAELVADKHSFFRPVIDLLIFMERGQIVNADTIAILRGVIKEIEENSKSNDPQSIQMADTNNGGKSNGSKIS